VKERFARFFRSYSGSAIGFIVVLALLMTFMRWWAQVGYQEDRFGTKVVSAFSSLAIALAALWAGQGLKRRQEEAAHARAELALNVDLKAQIFPHQGRVALEIEVRVKNVSNKTWNLPMVYVFVHPVNTPPGAKAAGAAEIVPPEIWRLKGRNIARFSNTMTRLAPDEEEAFSNAYLLDEEVVQKTPYFLVLVEAVGAPDSWEFDKQARTRFDYFMDGKLKEGRVVPEAKGEAAPVRDTYMVIETTNKVLLETERYAKRVIILPPAQRDARGGSGQEGRIDPISEDKGFKKMLDSTMMWSRRKLVCVGTVTEAKSV